MSLRSSLRLAARHLVAALVVGLVAGVLGGLAISLVNKPEYTTTATVSMRVVDDPQVVGGNWPAIDQLTSSASALFTSARVLAPAGQSVEPKVTTDQLEKAMTVRQPTQSLVFSASLSGEQDRTMALMNAVVDEFQTAVAAGELPSYGGVSLEVGSAEVTSELNSASGLGRMGTVLAGVAIGLLMAFLYLFLRVLLNDRIHDADDLRELTDDSLLGDARNGGVTEVARVLSEGLDYLAPAPGANIVAVSGVDGSAAELLQALASATAERGASVALVDLDLEGRPVAGGQSGIANVVAGKASLADVAVVRDGVAVVAAGGPVLNPGEYLTRPGFGDALKQLSGQHDWVFINTTPLVVSSSGALAATNADTTLLVVQRGASSRSRVRAAMGLVEATGLKVAGYVLV